MAKPAGRGEAAGPELVWPGKRRPPRARRAVSVDALEVWGAPRGAPRNRLIAGDNLDVMAALAGELAGTVDLVYLDPPFATGGDFAFSARVAGADGKPERDRSEVAYRDRWSKGLGDYLGAMRDRLVLARELLSERGTIFLHCDWHVGHLLRCLLDEVFGPQCFKNEIVWRYRRWPAKTRVFQRMHDVIFWYGKHPGDRHAWTPLYEELAASTRKTWGTLRQIADFSSGRRKPSQTDEETPGAPLCDVWDIGIIAPIAHERLGYPTQKPEALLERILTAASRPGDLCADFYCGSGTTLAVAERLGRRWIGCDSGRLAIQTTRRRLLAMAARRPFALEAVRRPAGSIGAPAWSWPAGGPPREVSRAELDTRRVALGGEAPEPEGGGRAGGARVCARATAGGLVIALERPDGAGPGWLERIDGWAIDCAYGGAALAPRWHAQRTRRAAVPLESPPFADLSPNARIVVKIVDVLGGESFHLVRAPADAAARSAKTRSRTRGKARGATAER